MHRSGRRRILGDPRDAGPEVPLPPPPPGFEEIQRQELSRLFGLVTRARLILLPLALAFFVYAVVADQAPWRRVLLTALLPVLGTFFVLEWRRFRRDGFSPGAIERNLTVAVVGQLLISGVSGGVESPFMPMAVLLAFIVGLFVPRRVGYVLLAVQVAGIAALTALAATDALHDLNLDAFGGGSRGGHGDTLLLASALADALFVAVGRGIGRVARKSFDAMLRRALVAQEDALRVHAERAEELTALTAEIAHELKNPLASVKGLAALLDECASPKSAERLGVLRREVDRMQGILDEFLNFSRPLVPLAFGEVDLLAVAREVGALYEGVARERGIRLEVGGAPAQARGDARKVKQLLINLVQNALEASPRGGRVEIATGADGDAARVAVLDRGRGLDAGLGERAFQAGVTTKPKGSGLGLPIARQLARQHGGELSLRPREGGGVVAELTLPAAGTPPREAA